MDKIADRITDEMRQWYFSRTSLHMSLVQKYCYRLSSQHLLPKLLDRGIMHDFSKYIEPERTPYTLISWQYRCKDLGVEFLLSEYERKQLSGATLHHITTNKHHPEFHQIGRVALLNREDRDKPPQEIVDATIMPTLDIAEMCADWLAMAEEKGTKATDWADKNVNVRWRFTDSQIELIYKFLKS